MREISSHCGARATTIWDHFEASRQDNDVRNQDDAARDECRPRAPIMPIRGMCKSEASGLTTQTGRGRAGAEDHENREKDIQNIAANMSPTGVLAERVRAECSRAAAGENRKAATDDHAQVARPRKSRRLLWRR